MLSRSAVPFLAVLALAACSDSVTTVEFAKVCKTELDGKTVATTGYLHSPFTTLCRSAKRRTVAVTTCSFDLRDRPDGALRLSLNIMLGEGESRVSEVRLRARQGAAAVMAGDRTFLADGARVRVTGALRAVPNSLKPEETICWLDVEKIDRR